MLSKIKLNGKSAIPADEETLESIYEELLSLKEEAIANDCPSA